MNAGGRSELIYLIRENNHTYQRASSYVTQPTLFCGGLQNSDQDGLTRNWPVGSLPHFSQDSQSSIINGSGRYPRTTRCNNDSSRSKQQAGTKGNDGGAEETD